ncbi:C-type lectin lectoxin-Enh4 [Misgurnus anguillicaudatus]|uniref:C-type lectin lectoxin-Enh4 n=1 Tax=Misgurnus anguillicaudatus TaxID=75329 RepID=UPI003CCF847B
MDNNGKWNDSACDNNFTFVCYNDRENASQSYVLVPEGRTWSEAQRYCREFYTDLASVRNQTEYQQILNITRGNNVWIGLYRNRLWSDQSNSSFTYWLPYTPHVYPQPDNGFDVPGLWGAQHCTAVSGKYVGQWTDESCFAHLPFFCYSESDKYVTGLRVKFRSEEILSSSQFEAFIQRHEGFIRSGIHGNFTFSLRSYRKIGP